MNRTHTSTVAWQIRLVFFVMAAGLSFAWTTNAARADSLKPASQVSIASSGQVIVKGATVTSVSGNTITARVAWGSMSFIWTVTTDGSTHFSPATSSSAALKAIKIGDTIAFTGDIDTSVYNPTVIASVVKDTDLQKESVTEVGSLLNVDQNNKNFTVATSAGTTTVSVDSGTIMTLDGNNASLADMQTGVDIQIIGSLNTATNTMLAQRVSWKTPSESVTGARVGVISGFFSWLRGTHGALSFLGR
jgi:hypothetical protein